SVHDLALRPSMSTVQAPHWLVSQPTCAPGRLSCSRRKCTRSVRGSTCALRVFPFTVIEIGTMRVRPSDEIRRLTGRACLAEAAQQRRRNDNISVLPRKSTSGGPVTWVVTPSEHYRLGESLWRREQ